MEVKTPKEFFDNVLPSKFNPEKAKDFEAVTQVDLSGTNGGSWIITVKDQKLQTQEGKATSPDITLKMADKDFVDLVNGKLSAVTAFMNGKLGFKGNMSKGLKLLDMSFT